MTNCNIHSSLKLHTIYAIKFSRQFHIQLKIFNKKLFFDNNTFDLYQKLETGLRMKNQKVCYYYCFNDYCKLNTSFQKRSRQNIVSSLPVELRGDFRRTKIQINSSKFEDSIIFCVQARHLPKDRCTKKNISWSVLIKFA